MHLRPWLLIVLVSAYVAVDSNWKIIGGLSDAIAVILVLGVSIQESSQVSLIHVMSIPAINSREA
jgi:hypothetical protein